jgi:ligand-binding SRPBCC domain-containing protein
MRINIKTKVEQDYKSVFSKFDVQLFKKLKPVLIGLNVCRFDGCRKGDEVRVEISILGIKQRWYALVTDAGEDEKEIYFIDEGIVLPWFLKSWKHTHRIMKSTDNSIIIDDICYRGRFFLLDYLLFPVLYFQFYYRKHIYESYFKK